MKRNISITILLAIFMFMAMPTFSQVSNDNADEVNEYLDEHSDRKRAASSYDLRKILS